MHRGDSLDRGGSRLINNALLEGNRRQRHSESREQLAGMHKEIGIARLPELLVALHEGLVENGAAGRQRLDDRREQRAMKIIRYDDAGEILAESPGATVLEIEGHDLDLGVAAEAPLESRRIAISRHDTMTPIS